MIERKGTVYWFTGLSGAGKSTISMHFSMSLKDTGRPVVYLDGDIIREILGSDLGYDRSARLASAMRNSRLCRLLSDQGIDVVCATISLFHVCQEWNRNQIDNYREIYVKVSEKTLRERDSKGLYARAERGEIKDVVGIDIPAEFPLKPDIIIENEGEVTPEAISTRLLNDLALSADFNSN